MSYCRFSGESDVYVYDGGTLICCGCRLQEFFHTPSRATMIEHLQAHLEKGHRVPDHALTRLREEIFEFGDDVKEDEV